MSESNDFNIRQEQQFLSPKEEGIDFLGLLNIIWVGRRIMILFIGIFTALGIFVAKYSPIEYTAKTIMVPQIQSKSSGLGGLSSLASIAGFNFDAQLGSSAELSPLLYPQIVQSFPFQRIIMNTPLNWKNLSKPESLIDYYYKYYKPNPLDVVKKYTLGLPGLILGSFKKHPPSILQLPRMDSLISMSIQEKGMQEFLATRLTLTVNSKSGFITLSSSASEAIVAAQIVQKAQKQLQDQVTEYRINKAKQNLDFVQTLFKEKENEFVRAQAKLANFRDRNLYLGSAIAKTEEEKLQSDYQLAFTVYSEVAKQYENAKIKVKEDTPIFSILEPVSIPTEKSKPKKFKILSMWIILGGFIGIIYVFGNAYWRNIKSRVFVG